jgi:hypothetical protein
VGNRKGHCSPDKQLQKEINKFCWELGKKEVNTPLLESLAEQSWPGARRTANTLISLCREWEDEFGEPTDASALVKALETYHKHVKSTSDSDDELVRTSGSGSRRSASQQPSTSTRTSSARAKPRLVPASKCIPARTKFTSLTAPRSKCKPRAAKPKWKPKPEPRPKPIPRPPTRPPPVHLRSAVRHVPRPAKLVPRPGRNTLTAARIEPRGSVALLSRPRDESPDRSATWSNWHRAHSKANPSKRNQLPLHHDPSKRNSYRK